MEDKTTSIDINGVLRSYTQKNFDQESVDLAKSDLQYGLSREKVSVYMDKKYSIEQKRILSEALREDYPQMVMDALTVTGGLNVHQMKELVKAYKDGISPEEILEVSKKKMTAHDMNKCFMDAARKISELVQETDEKKTGKEDKLLKTEGEAQKNESESLQSIDTEQLAGAIVSQISSLLEGIGTNEEGFANINAKLDELKGFGMEKVAEESYRKQLDENERLLSDQQNKLNDAANKISELEHENRKLRKENEAMTRDIEGLQKEISERKENHGIDKTVNEKEKISVTESVPKSESSTVYHGDMHYQAQMVAKDGSVIPVVVERTERKQSRGMLAFSEKVFRSKTSRNMVRQLMGKGLDSSQMKQVKVAIEAGLTDEEVADLIESGFDAEMMAQTIEIVVADRKYN